MAKRVIEHFVDDIDGSEKDVETFTFALEGTSYEVDLGPKNAGKLRDALAPYIEAGRKVGRTGRTAATKSSSGKNSPEFLASVREWAKKNKIDVAPRGRIKQEVIDQYNAAN